MNIRTKMLLCFTVFLLLLNGAVFLLYQTSEEMMSDYDRRMRRLLLLNEVSQRTNRLMEQLNAYVSEKEGKYARAYEQQYRWLQQQRRQLAANLAVLSDRLAAENYEHMIESFLEEAALTVYHFQAGNIKLYSSHLHETMNIASFLQEETLNLIDDELTAYQKQYDEVARRNRDFRYMGMGLFVTTLLFGVLLAVFFSGRLTKPIILLSRAAQAIGAGRLDGPDVNPTTNDELRLLTITFNDMRRNLKQLIAEMKQKAELDRLVKELELKSLQSQINPHFLFNTLNTVAKMAYLEDAPQTSRLIEAVAAILRYNLGDLQRTVTLADEVRVAREYFFIQQTRFFDRIKFSLEAEPSCLGQRLPPLTLQPLIENAFIHGIESYEQGAELTVSIAEGESRVIVEVRDNGVGMDEQVKTEFEAFIRGEERESRREEGRGHSTGIGLRNVIRRLQLFYGVTDVVDIESAPGRGTTIRLRLPKWTKEG
ncbi:Sensor histidine kinase YpdA [Geobacillus thermodenitrificans]|uniref:sensor histidine kinase n=1 Tax=Geobacillus thermodenitrificans TaxID=33940 RepID=UPI000A28DDA3|nr:sensor histidine kinase [Geobacillus thermodenitrificans]ARP44188.1 Sensor histidine kinase YpdA [Geobacillus thermodenitrificans]